MKTKLFLFLAAFLGQTLASAEILPSRYNLAYYVGPAGAVALDLGSACRGLSFDASGTLYALVQKGTSLRIYKIDGDGSATQFADLSNYSSADGMAIAQDGTIYVADMNDRVILKVSNGVVSVYAGKIENAFATIQDGSLAAARFGQPRNVAIDTAGILYVSDSNCIRKVSNGSVTTVAGLPQFNQGQGYADGSGTSARFNNPNGLAVDVVGNIFVCDSGNYVVRQIASNGTVTTVAGQPNQRGYVDGSFAVAFLGQPWQIAIASDGTLYVSDVMNNRLRKVCRLNATVSTVVRAVGSSFYDSSALVNPSAVAISKSQDLYIADTSDYTKTAVQIIRQAVSAEIANGRLSNLSGRSTTGTGNKTVIAGFVVKGQIPLEARGVGPGAIPYGVTNPVQDPKLTVYNSASVVTNVNDNWAFSQSTVDRFNRLGAFSLTPGSTDAEVYLPNASGLNTMFVTGNTGDGTTLVEVYDASASLGPVDNPDTTSRLINLSMRGQVTADDPLIAGFVIVGAPRTVLIRAGGPALKGYGISDALADPVLTLYKGQLIVTQNDNWGGDADLQATATKVGAFDFQPDSKDAVILATRLPPGAYTAMVTGANGATGPAVVEVYEVP